MTTDLYSQIEELVGELASADAVERVLNLRTVCRDPDGNHAYASDDVAGYEVVMRNARNLNPRINREGFVAVAAHFHPNRPEGAAFAGDLPGGVRLGQALEENSPLLGTVMQRGRSEYSALLKKDLPAWVLFPRQLCVLRIELDRLNRVSLVTLMNAQTRPNRK